jgi:hypothetical protein
VNLRAQSLNESMSWKRHFKRRVQILVAAVRQLADRSQAAESAAMNRELSAAVSGDGIVPRITCCLAHLRARSSLFQVVDGNLQQRARGDRQRGLIDVEQR